MIDIYICEDVQKQRELLNDYVKTVIMFEEYDMELKLSTDDMEVLLQGVRESKNIGLYFLDIDLGNGKNGLELAKEIREYDPRGFIVFVTSHSEMAKLTFQYKVEALDFIVKDDPQDIQYRIGECMEKAIERSGHISRGEGKTVTIVRGGQKIILNQDDIMFVETSANEHKLLVHTNQTTTEFFGKIKDMEQEVGDDFFRCHRSYLVNKKWVKEVDYGNRIIYLKNGVECPVSARMLSQVKRKLK
jgi:two-component system response regulator AgrA